MTEEDARGGGGGAKEVESLWNRCGWASTPRPGGEEERGGGTG